MTPPVDLTVEHHDWKPLVRNQQAPALDALNHGRDVALRDPSGKLVGLSVHVQPELADMLPWLVRMLRLRLHWDDARQKLTQDGAVAWSGSNEAIVEVVGH